MLYLALYFGFFIPFQSFSKFYLVVQKKREAREKKKNDDEPVSNRDRTSFRALKYYNSKDSLALMGDRTVGNFVEFAILFLPLYWMNALFVDCSKSRLIGVLYTGSRLLYPFLFNRGWTLLLSTAPGYVIYLYLMYQITFKFALTQTIYKTHLMFRNLGCS